MQPINFTGPPSYFNRDGSPSLALRWAGFTGPAGGGSNYSAVEIQPAATNPRPFYVIGYVTDQDGQSVFMYRGTTSRLTTVAGTLAANSTTEFGSVATNSVIKYGDTTTAPAETDSDITDNIGASLPLYKLFAPPLYIPAGSYFTLVKGTVNSAFFANFYFCELVQP